MTHVEREHRAVQEQNVGRNAELLEELGRVVSLVHDVAEHGGCTQDSTQHAQEEGKEKRRTTENVRGVCADLVFPPGLRLEFDEAYGRDRLHRVRTRERPILQRPRTEVASFSHRVVASTHSRSPPSHTRTPPVPVRMNGFVSTPDSPSVFAAGRTSARYVFCTSRLRNSLLSRCACGRDLAQRSAPVVGWGTFRMCICASTGRK